MTMSVGPKFTGLRQIDENEEPSASGYRFLLSEEADAQERLLEQTGMQMRELIERELTKSIEQQKRLMDAANQNPDLVHVRALSCAKHRPKVLKALTSEDYLFSSLIPEHHIRRRKVGDKPKVAQYLRCVQNVCSNGENMFAHDIQEENTLILVKDPKQDLKYSCIKHPSIMTVKSKLEIAEDPWINITAGCVKRNNQPTLIDEVRGTAYALRLCKGSIWIDRDPTEREQSLHLYNSVTIFSYLIPQSPQDSQDMFRQRSMKTVKLHKIPVSASLICPRDGSILLLSQVKEDGKLDFQLFQPSDVTMNRFQLVTSTCDMHQLSGWRISTQQDYHIAGSTTVKQNYNSLVWWQNGTVLVVMLQRSSVDRAIAIFHMEYDDQSLVKISNVHVIPLEQSQVPLPVVNVWPPLLVGHHRRFLVFRLDHLNFAAMKCLYQRPRRIPTAANRVEWQLWDGLANIERLYESCKDPVPFRFDSVYVSCGGQIITKCQETLCFVTSDRPKPETVAICRHRLFLKFSM